MGAPDEKHSLPFFRGAGSYSRRAGGTWTFALRRQYAALARRCARVDATSLKWAAKLPRRARCSARGRQGESYSAFARRHALIISRKLHRENNGATREMLWPGPASPSALATHGSVGPGRDAGRAKHGGQPRVSHGPVALRRAAGLGVWGAA